MSNTEQPFFCAGVLGRPAIHSRSPQLFRTFFESAQLPGVYLRLAVDSVEEIRSIQRFLPLCFLNITSPFKYEVDVFAGKRNAAGKHAKNVLWKVADGWETDNTDQAGIRSPLAPWLGGEPGKVLVIGSGGAAEAAIQALEGQNLTICARNDQRVAQLKSQYPEFKTQPWPHLPEAVEQAYIIVYTIPGRVAPDLGVRFRTGQVVLDANYQDSLQKAGLIKDSLIYLDGFDWLVYQAIPAIKRFVPGHQPDIEALKSAVREDHLAKMDRIALVGLPGSGKSTVGESLASCLGRPFIDLDRAIQRACGMDIPTIFREKGEAWFRKKETEALSTALSRDKILVACGGGAVGVKENRELLKEKGFPVWLMVYPPIAAGRLENEERPLFDNKDMIKFMQRLHKDRLPFYAEVSEICIDVSNRSINQVVERLYEAYHSVR